MTNKNNPTPAESSSRPESRATSLVTPLFFSVLFGFAAGAVGMMFVAAYFLPTPDSSGASALSIMRGRTTRQSEEYGAVPTPVDTSSRSLALIFRVKPAGIGLLDQVYLPQEAVAAGGVLTSDGWIVTAGEPFAKSSERAANLVAAIGAKVYAVQTIIRDDYSGAVFLKVDASNLPVAAFGEAALGAGDGVFSYDALRGAHRIDFVGYGRTLPTRAADYVVSSESLQSLLRLSSANGALPGSMLVDSRGGFIGVLSGNDAVGSFGIPLPAFEDQLLFVLRGKAPVRSRLGVNYVDLSQVVSGASSRPDLNRGAMLTDSLDGRRPAVIRNSPAADANLKEGDVILAVNDREISAGRPLSDVLAEYEPGTELTLAVQRGEAGANLTVKVKLDEAPGASRD
ncbi:MAG: PDZ domain-containing protein [Patescibacteria group bacterium]|nr:PDZ domain-containing protein [Patescibacteria group bacterium]